MNFRRKVMLRRALCVLVTVLVLGWSLDVLVHKFSLTLRMEGIRSPTQDTGHPATKTMVIVTHDQLEKMRRELSSGLRSTAAFLRSSLRDLSSKVNSSANENINSLLAEAEDRISPTQDTGHPATKTMVIVTHDQLEKMRRELSSGLRSTAAFLRSSLRDLSSKVNSSANENINSLLAEAEDRIRVIQLDLSSLDQLGNLTDWREKEASILSQEVQRRIHALQNPKNCSNAKKIVCSMTRAAGAGSLIHHLVYCIMAAYGSGKTFVLHSRGWRYSPGGWEVLFQPLSLNCVNVSSGVIDPWPGTNESEAVMFPEWDKPKPKPVHQPMAVPVDIARRLKRFHEMPSAWWVGQFISYMMRLKPEMQEIIDRVQMQLKFSNPIVGVHVRRTDKKAEAKLFPIDEYMIHVENYYLDIDLKSTSVVPVRRRVFLASDENSVITEAKKRYPNYEFLWHKNNAEKQKNRYNLLSFKDLITELYFLAHSDFLVCTFSSNVCRLAYEMMQPLHADAPSRIISLDTNYFFHQARPGYLKVRFPHRPNKSAKKKGFLEADAGQTLQSIKRNVAGTGYIKVQNFLRKKATGLMPDYKIREILDVVNVTVV